MCPFPGIRRFISAAFVGAQLTICLCGLLALGAYVTEPFILGNTRNAVARLVNRHVAAITKYYFIVLVNRTIQADAANVDVVLVVMLLFLQEMLASALPIQE